MKVIRTLAAGTVIAVIAVMAGRVEAQSWPGSQGEPMASFGASVLVDGDRVLVGRSNQGGAFTDQTGAVHIFSRDPASNTWKEAGTFKGADTRIGDEFGFTMTLDGDLLAVSAPKSGNGAVYLFQRRGQDWVEMARIAAQENTPNDEFGRALALRNGMLLIGAPSRDSLRGAVYVSRRDSRGTWSAPVELARGTEPFERLGRTIAFDGTRALVSAPGPISFGTFKNPNTRRGVVRVFRTGSGGAWTAEGTIEPQGDSLAAFGAGMLLSGNEAMITAPMSSDNVGWIGTFSRRPSGEWVQTGVITPPARIAGQGFGYIALRNGNDLLVAEPGARGFAGVIEVFRRVNDGWSHQETLAALDSGVVGFTGMSVDTKGSVLVAGAPNATYGLGEGFVWMREGSGRWVRSATVHDTPPVMTAVRSGEVKCASDKAAIFACDRVDLEAFLPKQDLGASRGINMNDIWGWTDPASKREFALVGRMDGTAFVEVTNPAQPVFLGSLPMTSGARANAWRDIKVYKDHAFIVADGAGQHGMQVFDLRQLLSVSNAPVTFKETALYTRIASAHNIAINEQTGFAFTIGNSAGGETCGGALHMINIQDPANPVFAGCFADPSTGNAKTGYTHDTQCVTYAGPDNRYTGREICFNSSETAVGIADVTDKQNPKALAVASYPNTSYTHQGWLDESQSYFFVDDEGDEISGVVPKTRTLVWDVKNLEEPVLIKEFFGTTSASDHNLYIKGRYMYQANYVSGLRVIDISDPKNPREVGYFDTVPYGENTPGFEGAWSVYPYFPSGTIVVNSIGQGLFVLKHRPVEPATP